MEIIKEQPNYYAIIPANVRYDKKLSQSAKLLYGEITALTNEKGYCWASNKYFSDLYKVTKQSISSWIKQLKDRGYIGVTINYKENSREIKNRYIRLLEHPIQENLNTPIQVNPKENTTTSSITTTFPSTGAIIVLSSKTPTLLGFLKNCSTITTKTKIMT